ncbi:MAG: hypothetical protein QM753_12935, partial [Thermomicrobiales bacterium]
MQDAQDLLVVRVAGLGVGELVEVHHLVHHHEQAAEPRQPHEAGEQFQHVVDIAIVDDGAHAKRVAGIRARAELATQPAHGVALQLLVASIVPLPVAGDYFGEVVAASEFGQLLQVAPDDRVRVFPGSAGIGQRLGDEALDHAGHRAAIWLGPGGHVAHQFGVEAACLASGGVEAAIRREVGVDGDELLLERNRADDVEEERLARTVFADHEPHRRPAIGNPLDIGEQRADFVDAPDLHVLLPGARHDARSQQLQQGVAFARADWLGNDGWAGRIGHERGTPGGRWATSIRRHQVLFGFYRVSLLT